MAMTRVTGAGLGALLAAAVLAAGCGTERPGGSADARTGPAPTGISRPSTPVNFRCPGESASAVPTPTAHRSGSEAAPPANRDVENHGFQVPFSLYGQSRCDGIEAVTRIEKALEPMRERGDFASEAVREVLTGLGYSSGETQTTQIGPAEVGFLIDVDDSPLLCVEGTMSPGSTHAEAFGGYPDHHGCDLPSGGH